MSSNEYVDAVLPRERGADSSRDMRIKLYLQEVLASAMVLEEGEIDFDTNKLDALDSIATSYDVRRFLMEARDLTDMQHSNAKKPAEREAYSAVGRFVYELSLLYAEPSSNLSKRGPNNPYTSPAEKGSSLSRAGDAMRHRSGKRRY